MLAEARQALLLSRVGAAVDPEIDGQHPLMTARQALELATLGGAAVLGRDDVGSLKAGKAADFIAINLQRIGYSGGLHDPVAATVLCEPVGVDYNYVHGRPVVYEGQMTTVELPELIEAHNDASIRLANSVA
jgi:cytosine/adenosine deaminase-related metal-dependent hydrolase